MQNQKAQSYFLFGMIAATGLLCFFILRPFLIPLALAGIVAIALNPLFKRVLKRVGDRPSLAALLTLIVGLVLLAAPIGILATQIVRDAASAYGSLSTGPGKENVSRAIISAGSYAEPFYPGATVKATEAAANVNTYAEQALSWLLANTLYAFSGVLQFLLHTVIFLLAVFYSLRNGAYIRTSLKELSPLAPQDTQNVFDRLIRTTNSIVKGKLVIALIQGTLAGIGFYIFGLPSPILWAAVTGLASLLPGFGTMLITYPASAYLLLIGQPGMALGLFLWSTLVVGLVDNLLSPILIGRGAQMNEFIILLSILGGLAFFGPAGIFLGPIAVSFFTVLFAIYAKDVRSQKTVS